MSKTSVPGEIFKAYDIRGLFPDEIDGQIAYRIARAFVRVLAVEGRIDEDKSTPGLRIALGHDMRLSSPELSARFRDGLVDEGCHVVDIGTVGTEMLYYMVGSRGLDGGAMITASHNPKAYTGMKLVREGALALSADTGINEIGRFVETSDFDQPTVQGDFEEVDVYDEYRKSILSFIDPGQIRPLKVVLDGGNGMAGPMVLPLLEGLPIEQIRRCMEPDGNFPNHEPNPLLEENRREIMATVSECGADLGIAWDGDADRCFFIDNQGEFVPGDFLTALLANQILKKAPGSTILYDVRASRAVKNTVESAGGRALINRVGHSFFKKRMREADAVFGGEVSGHYYFRDFWCADSGMIPALLILELLSQEDRSFSDVLATYRDRYFISGEINSEVADKQAKMDELTQHYRDGEVSHLDGISVDYDDWHFNVRPSNTEPLLRLNLEADTKEGMEMRSDELLEIIRDGN